MMNVVRRRLLGITPLPIRFTTLTNNERPLRFTRFSNNNERRFLGIPPSPKSAAQTQIFSDLLVKLMPDNNDRRFLGIPPSPPSPKSAHIFSDLIGLIVKLMPEYTDVGKIKKSMSVGDKITVRNRHTLEIIHQGVVKHIGLRTTTIIIPNGKVVGEVFVPSGVLYTPTKYLADRYIDNHSRKNTPYPATPYQKLVDTTEKLMKEMVDTFGKLLDMMEDTMEKEALVDKLFDVMKKKEIKKDRTIPKPPFMPQMYKQVEVMQEVIGTMEKLLDAKEKEENEALVDKLVDAMEELVDTREKIEDTLTRW